MDKIAIFIKINKMGEIMKKIFLIGVPHHNNLGDNAIAEAEERFIKDNFKDYEYFEVAEENVSNEINKIKTEINDKDIIFYHGGGNMGDEYLYIEKERRMVIEEFPNNLIIIFPQTIYFKTEEELAETKRIYSKHKKLVIIAREETSFEIMKREFKNNIILKTPDIVTYLNETKNEIQRKGLLCILRNDVEKKTTEEEKRIIQEQGKRFFDKIQFDDTACGEPILPQDRLEKLENMFEKYRRVELVITDRLHGMIFAAITSTPCIALNNYNHKVKDTAKYLENLGYIRYIDDIKDLTKNIKELSNIKYKPYDCKIARDKLNQIVEIVNKNEQGGNKREFK